MIRQWYEKTKGYIGVFPPLESHYMWTVVSSTEKWEGRRGEKAKVTQERTVTGTEDVKMYYKAEATSYHRRDGDDLQRTCGYIDTVLKERKAAFLQLCRVLVKLPFCLLLSLLTLNEVFVQMPDMAEAFRAIRPAFLGTRSYLGFLFAQADGLAGRLLHAAVGVAFLSLFSWLALPVSRKKGSIEKGTGFKTAGILLAFLFGIGQFCQGGDSTAMIAVHALCSQDGYGTIPVAMDTSGDGIQVHTDYVDVMYDMAKARDDFEQPVQMYRRILAESDTKVNIITLGFLQNIQALMHSAPDQYSPLTGAELITRKVDSLYIVGGLRQLWRLSVTFRRESSFCRLT